MIIAMRHPEHRRTCLPVDYHSSPFRLHLEMNLMRKKVKRRVFILKEGDENELMQLNFP